MHRGFGFPATSVILAAVARVRALPADEESGWSVTIKGADGLVLAAFTLAGYHQVEALERDMRGLGFEMRLVEPQGQGPACDFVFVPAALRSPVSGLSAGEVRLAELRAHGRVGRGSASVLPHLEKQVQTQSAPLDRSTS
jgi:hypothetical protein